MICPARYVYVNLPTCPECNTFRNLKVYKTIDQGEEGVTRYTLCRACGCRFIVVATPDPSGGID